MLLPLVSDALGMPVKLAIEVLEKLRDEVDRERLATEESIKERLQSLQLDLQDGALAESDYEEMETVLLERLRAIRAYREESNAA